MSKVTMRMGMSQADGIVGVRPDVRSVAEQGRPVQTEISSWRGTCAVKPVTRAGLERS